MIDFKGTKCTVYKTFRQEDVAYHAVVVSITEHGIFTIQENGRMSVAYPTLVKMHLSCKQKEFFKPKEVEGE